MVENFRSAYVGGYAGTDTPSKGITRLRIDAATGQPSVVGAATDVPNPFHLVVSPTGATLYAVSNVVDGAVHALRIEPDGGLTELGQQSSGGAGAVHADLDLADRHLLVANHDSATVAVLPIDADGRLGPVVCTVAHTGSGPDPVAQSGPHPHQIVLDPSGHRVLVPDKGTDHVHIHCYDAWTGLLTEESTVRIGVGVGPRQLAFHPDGSHVYVVCELTSTVAVCDYDVPTGALSVLDTVSTLPDGADGWNAPSAIRVSADGRFVYVGNRGHESVAVFAVHDGGARLSQLSVPRVTEQPGISALPWDLVLGGHGAPWALVANQLAGTVTALHVDVDSGLPERSGEPAAVPTPACIALS